MIEVKMVCKCGNIATAEYTNQRSSGCLILPTDVMYICGDCGKEMSLRVVKLETTETETIVKQGD